MKEEIKFNDRETTAKLTAMIGIAAGLFCIFKLFLSFKDITAVSGLPVFASFARLYIFVRYPLMAIGSFYLIAGLTSFFGKKSGRGFSLTLSWLSLYAVCLALMIFGRISIEGAWPYIIIAVYFIAVLNFEGVREHYKISQAENKRYNIGVIMGLVFLSLVCCGYFYLLRELDLKYPGLREKTRAMVLKRSASEEYSKNYIKRKILNFEAWFPSKQRLVNYSPGGAERAEYTLAVLSDEESDEIVVLSDSSIFGIYMNLSREMGIEVLFADESGLAEFLINERTGLVPLMIKGMTENYGFFEFDTGRVKGYFKSKDPARMNRAMSSFGLGNFSDAYYYELLDKKSGGTARVLLGYTAGISQTTAENIIDSFEFTGTDEVSQKARDEGRRLLGRGEFEEAKFQLARAAYLSPADADIRFDLARAFEMSGCFNAARVNAAETLKLKSDHAGALEIMQRIDEARRKSSK